MIEEVYRVSDTKDLAAIQKTLQHLHSQATAWSYSDEEPTIKTVPFGAVVVYDNGAGTKRLYVRTGKDNVGYVSLT